MEEMAEQNLLELDPHQIEKVYGRTGRLFNIYPPSRQSRMMVRYLTRMKAEVKDLLMPRPKVTRKDIFDEIARTYFTFEWQPKWRKYVHNFDRDVAYILTRILRKRLCLFSGEPPVADKNQ